MSIRCPHCLKYESIKPVVDTMNLEQINNYIVCYLRAMLENDGIYQVNNQEDFHNMIQTYLDVDLDRNYDTLLSYYENKQIRLNPSYDTFTDMISFIELQRGALTLGMLNIVMNEAFDYHTGSEALKYYAYYYISVMSIDDFSELLEDCD